MQSILDNAWLLSLVAPILRPVLLPFLYHVPRALEQHSPFALIPDGEGSFVEGWSPRVHDLFYIQLSVGSKALSLACDPLFGGLLPAARPELALAVIRGAYGADPYGILETGIDYLLDTSRALAVAADVAIRLRHGANAPTAWSRAGAGDVGFWIALDRACRRAVGLVTAGWLAPAPLGLMIPLRRMHVMPAHSRGHGMRIGKLGARRSAATSRIARPGAQGDGQARAGAMADAAGARRDFTQARRENVLAVLGDLVGDSPFDVRDIFWWREFEKECLRLVPEASEHFGMLLAFHYHFDRAVAESRREVVRVFEAEAAVDQRHAASIKGRNDDLRAAVAMVRAAADSLEAASKAMSKSIA
jgi:hypothetical protein